MQDGLLDFSILQLVFSPTFPLPCLTGWLLDRECFQHLGRYLPMKVNVVWNDTLLARLSSASRLTAWNGLSCPLCDDSFLSALAIAAWSLVIRLPHPDSKR